MQFSVSSLSLNWPLQAEMEMDYVVLDGENLFRIRIQGAWNRAFYYLVIFLGLPYVVLLMKIKQLLIICRKFSTAGVIINDYEKFKYWVVNSLIFSWFQ